MKAIHLRTHYSYNQRITNFLRPDEVLAIEYYCLNSKSEVPRNLRYNHFVKQNVSPLKKFRTIKLPVLPTIGSPRHPVLAVSQVKKSSHGTHEPAQAISVHHHGPRRESDEVLVVYGRVIELEVVRAQWSPVLEPHVINILIAGLVASNPVTPGARSIDILVAAGLVASNPVAAGARAVDILVAGLVASDPVASSARAIDIFVAAGHRRRHGGSSKS